MSADSRATAETGSVFGPRFRRMLQAHLLTGNGVGIELFEPIGQNPNLRRRGFATGAAAHLPPVTTPHEIPSNT